MQIVKCNVHLSSDRNHVVTKTGVTVAEIEILRTLHGEDAVTDIYPTKQDTRKHADELDRLRRVYKRKLPGPDAKGSKNVVDIVYPGPRPNLPATLKDIGVDYPKGASAEEKKAEAKAKAEAAKAPEPDPKAE
mgnify:CR=1 FL=1